MSRKKTVKKKTTKPVKRHPLAQQLNNIQKQIEDSPLFLNAVEFIEGLHQFMNKNLPTETNVTNTLREIMEMYVNEVEMFITEKDRVAELVRIKLEYDVLSVRESKGRFTLQVLQEGKKKSIYVKKKGDGYVYGHGDFEIGDL